MSFKRKPPAGNVRRVRATGKNIRGVVTNKAGRLVQFESWLERALMLQLDRDPDVLDYGSQPEIFEFSDEQGKTRTYTPDFIVWRQHSKVEIHEVTVSKRRLRLDIQRREKAARQICQDRGWCYVVHTEQSLPQGSKLANLLALNGYRATSYTNQKITRTAFEQLAQNQVMVLTQLVNHIEHSLNLPKGQVTAALCHLLWHGHLSTDFEQLLFDDGEIIPGICVWLEHRRQA